MDKDLIEDNSDQIIDPQNERKSTPVKVRSLSPNKIYLFYNGIGRISKILFGNDDKIIKLVIKAKS